MKITIAPLDTTPAYFVRWLREYTRELCRECFPLDPTDSALLARLRGISPPGNCIFLRRPVELAVDPRSDPHKGERIIRDGLREIRGLPPAPKPSQQPEVDRVALQAGFLALADCADWKQDKLLDGWQTAVSDYERMCQDECEGRLEPSEEYPWAFAARKVGDAITFHLTPLSDSHMQVTIECGYRTVASYVGKTANAIKARWPEARIVDGPAGAEAKWPEKALPRHQYIPDYRESLPKAYKEHSEAQGERPTNADLAAVFAVSERTIKRRTKNIREQGGTWPP